MFKNILKLQNLIIFEKSRVWSNNSFNNKKMSKNVKKKLLKYKITVYNMEKILDVV